ncbi:MAG: DNA-binding protein, partial [Clostridium butyricum]
MVKDFEDRCVFDELKEFYYNNNGELYSYQDFEKSGVKEFNMSSHKINDLKVYEKNRLADDFIRIFLDIAQDKEEITVLEGYVTLKNRNFFFI